MVDREDTTATIHSLDLKELFSRGCWQHVIFLTYSFDLPFFETTLLPILEKNGSQFITVVADAEWLAKRLLKWLERGQIHDAGKKYLLCGAKVAGAFHPKVILGVSKTGGAVLVGSGNISTYGMAHGGELFTVLEWQGQQVHPLAREAWELCKRISKDIPTDVRFAQHVDIMANSIFGMLIPPKLRLLWCNLEEPLLPQLIQEIASSAVTDLLLWAPFADRNLVALQELVEQLQPGHVTMALQPKITNIDGRRLEALAASYSSIRWDFVELEQKEPLKHEMMIHAKGILMTLATGEDILLVGSPNLSAPALLQTAQDGNLEVALLLRGRSLLGQLFPENLISLGKPVDLHTLTWRSDMFDDAQTQAKTQVVLLGASMENQTLTLTIAGICPLSARLWLNSSEHLQSLIQQNGIISVQITEGTLPQVVKLVWDGGESNAVIVTQPQRLIEQARQKDASPSVSLERLVHGGDAEWAAFLEKLAELTIIDSYDLIRLAGGLPKPTIEEEAKEAEHPVTSEDLGHIDFKTIMENRASHSPTATFGGLLTSTSSYQINEVVAYFKMLLDKQQQQLVTPDITSDLEERDFELPDTPQPVVQFVSVGRRIRLLLQHRLRRFINGFRSPAFYQKVPHALIIKNYIWFLNVIEVVWKHSQSTNTSILPANIYSELCCDLLSAFWGNDLVEGYWASLDELQRFETGLMLVDNEADALTLASAYRLLNEIHYHLAPFVIAQIVRMTGTIGIFTTETTERALVYLDQPELDPVTLLHQLEKTQQYFSWDRFLQKLRQRYQLKGATLEKKGFDQGKTLVIRSDKDILSCPNVLAVFADWIEVCAEHEPDRSIFQMLWGDHEELLVYNADPMKLSCRLSGTQKAQTLSTGISPSEFSSWLYLPPG